MACKGEGVDMSAWGPRERGGMTPEQIERANKMLGQGYTPKEMAERFHVSQQYISKHCTDSIGG
jgi:DNA-binding CsgD family transcriptional regulator